MYTFMKYYNWQKFVHQKYKVVLFSLHITTLKLFNYSVALHIYIAYAASVVHCDAKYLESQFFWPKISRLTLACYIVLDFRP